MYEIGQLVLYGSHGVCKVLNKEIRTIDRKKVEYLVLEPIDQQDSRFLVPTSNAVAMAKLSPILTKEEIENLLSDRELIADAWIEDENIRKQKYRELIVGSDRSSLISMIRALYIHKEKQQEAGRKFHLCDENFLRDAEKLLSAEFSVVLGISRQQVGQYIADRLQEFRS